MSSIRLRLLKWLVAPILAVNLGVAALIYLLAWTPAQLAFDDGLRNGAAALALRVQQEGVGVLARAQGAQASDEAGWAAVHDGKGRLLTGSAALAAPRGLGLRDDRIGDQPVRVAVASIATENGTRYVSLARTTRARQEVRAATLRSLVLIEVVFSLALVGLVWFSVGNGLAPLVRLRARLNARGSGDLAPLKDDDIPRELAPLVGAFNALLARIANGARAQDEFRANVAHQLRTPLAGVRLQLEWLAARHANDPETRRSIQLMLGANERMIRQTNQLLSLERAEPTRFARERVVKLDLAHVVAGSVQSFVERAAARDIDLGFELKPARVKGDSHLLRDLVDNLVDNALRYTPAGGRVTVACGRNRDGAFLRVEDNGPGIPPERREQVFQRFVRLDEGNTGSGLGLAIVREVAHLHRATVVLSDSPEGGAAFLVTFP